MTGGLLAPLGPKEEIALRRIAHGSCVVDAEAASKLIALALIERTSSSLRLTPLGRLRFNALPKAPLLGRPRSIHSVNGYVEGLIEKAQLRAGAQAGAPRRPAGLVASASLLPEAEEERDEDGHGGEVAIYQPVYFFFDSQHWRSQAERKLVQTRRAIMEHRRRHVRLCDTSAIRLERSRSLLKGSVPVWPRWLHLVK